MNLFWKKTFGILMPTHRYEKLEVDFVTASEKYKAMQYSAAVHEYQQVKHKMKDASPEEQRQLLARLEKLEQHPDLKFITKDITKKNRPHRNAYLTFNDDFYWPENQPSAWNFGFYFQNNHRKQHYSFVNEKQANNKGLNTFGDKGLLQIHTKREQVQSLAWHAQKGFVNQEFAFSSDVVQTAKNFKQTGGIFKAKLRCTGNIHHAFWLGSEAMEPHINIFHFDGANIQVGYTYKGKTYQAEIKGINPSEYYIYTLEWRPNELIWYINNIEVLRAPNDNLYREMCLTLNSFIPEKIVGEEGLLEVEWVRAYQFV